MTEREAYGEGRFVDPELGTLSGEAAEQRVPDERLDSEGGPPAEVFKGVPSQGPPVDSPTYYDRPVLKEPTWIWSVPAYFYAGGVAGAAALLGAAAQLMGDGELRGLVKRCRWTAAASAIAGTGLLVIDLGRPARFLNMLRVFRPTSPMSVGSWVLAAATPLATGSAVLSEGPELLRSMGDAAGIGAGALGLPLAGYTSVLLSSTAVPVWQGTRRSLPPLFVASAASSAASLLDLMALNEREYRVVRRFGVLGKAAELAAASAVEHEGDEVERVGRPLREGVSGMLWRAAKGLTAASLVLSALPGKSRSKRVLSGVLGTLGGIGVRFAVFHAGKASAADPRATFEMQRAGHGGSTVAA